MKIERKKLSKKKEEEGTMTKPGKIPENFTIDGNSKLIEWKNRLVQSLCDEWTNLAKRQIAFYVEIAATVPK